MERLQAYKFQLRPKAGQESLMRRFAGCCRFLWNKALVLEKETYEKEGKRLGFSLLCEAVKKQVKNSGTCTEDFGANKKFARLTGLGCVASSTKLEILLGE